MILFGEMMTTEVVLRLINYLEQALCSLISFPLLGVIRPEKKKLFWCTYIGWTTWGLVRLFFIIKGDDWTSLVLTVTKVMIFLMITFFGMALEGGMFRALAIILFQDVSMSAMTILVEAAAALAWGIPFARMFSDTSLSYSPALIIAFFVGYMLFLYVIRGWLKNFREIPIERYSFIRILEILFLCISASSIGYIVVIPGYSNPQPGNMVLFILIGLVLLWFGIYQIRVRKLFEQNLVLKQQNQIMKEHTTVYREQIALTRKLRHDIRRHLQMLEWSREGEINQDLIQKRTTYLKELQKMYDQLQTGDYTGESEVDAILFQMEQYCRKKAIPCRVQVNQMGMNTLPTGRSKELFFYICYWIIQCCEAVQAEIISVQFTGGSIAGVNRLKAVIRRNEPVEKAGREKRMSLHHDYISPEIQKDICRQIEAIIDYKGDVKVQIEDAESSMAVEWTDPKRMDK